MVRSVQIHCHTFPVQTTVWVQVTSLSAYSINGFQCSSCCILNLLTCSLPSSAKYMKSYHKHTFCFVWTLALLSEKVFIGSLVFSAVQLTKCGSNQLAFSLTQTGQEQDFFHACINPIRDQHVSSFKTLSRQMHGSYFQHNANAMTRQNTWLLMFTLQQCALKIRILLFFFFTFY